MLPGGIHPRMGITVALLMANNGYGYKPTGVVHSSRT